MSKRPSSCPLPPKKVVAREPASFSSLPAEIITAIFDYIQPSEWRTYSRSDVGESTVHSLAAVCWTFRNQINSRVTRLQLINACPVLTPTMIFNKIRACSARLQVLTLTRLFFSADHLVSTLAQIITQCSQLQLLVGSYGHSRRVSFLPGCHYHPSAVVIQMAEPPRGHDEFLCARSRHHLIKVNSVAEDHTAFNHSPDNMAKYQNASQLVYTTLLCSIDTVHPSSVRFVHDGKSSSLVDLTQGKGGGYPWVPVCTLSLDSVRGADRTGSLERPMLYQAPSRHTFFWANIALESGVTSLRLPLRCSLQLAPWRIPSISLQDVTVYTVDDARHLLALLEVSQEITVWAPLSIRDDLRRLARPGVSLAWMLSSDSHP